MVTGPSRPSKIKINVVSAYEDFAIDPARCSVFRDKDVEWIITVDNAPADEFLLVFDSDEAFGRSVLWHTATNQLGPQRPIGASGSEYHYKIVVKKGDTVYADVYCPSIIIR